MSWSMIGGWREDFNEGPYDYLAVRDGWEIFQLGFRTPVSLTDPGGEVATHDTIEEAKNSAYKRGCNDPSRD